MLTTTKLNLALFLARVPLGAYFVIAGFNKLAGPGGLTGFVEAAKGTVPSGMEQFGNAYLHALPFVEIAAGLFVILGLVVRLNAFLMALMLASFIYAMKLPMNVARIHPVEGAKPFDPNIVLLGLALCLTLLGAGEWGSHRAFRRRRRVIVATEPGTVATTSRGTPIV